MNALTMHAGPNREAGLRPVPWRRMAWVTWQQHRATLGGLCSSARSRCTCRSPAS